MLPFVKQVQLTSDFAKNGIGRMVGEPPKFPDEEKTFDELKARIAKTLDYVRSIKAADIDAAADKDVTFPVGPQSMTLPGEHVPHQLRAAELLFPRHHGLRHPAPGGRRDRQAGFPRTGVSRAARPAPAAALRRGGASATQIRHIKPERSP